VQPGDTTYLGDHMALVVEEISSAVTTPGEILNNYSISMEKCWASDENHAATYTEEAVSGSTYSSEVIYPDNQGGYSTTFTSGKQLTLWDQHCPQHYWVSPHYGAAGTSHGNYLNENWDRTTDIREIHFRQFGFNGYGSGTSTMYYHCLIRVCPTANAGTCNTVDIDGVANTCTNPASYGPSGRKRRTVEGELGELSAEIVAAVDVKIPKEAQKNSDSGAMTTAATATMAIFGLLNL